MINPDEHVWGNIVLPVRKVTNNPDSTVQPFRGKKCCSARIKTFKLFEISSNITGWTFQKPVQLWGPTLHLLVLFLILLFPVSGKSTKARTVRWSLVCCHAHKQTATTTISRLFPPRKMCTCLIIDSHASHSCHGPPIAGRWSVARKRRDLLNRREAPEYILSLYLVCDVLSLTMAQFWEFLRGLV